VTTTQGYRSTSWTPYAVPAGKAFFVGFRTPSSGTLTAPWTSDAATTTQEAYYYRSSSSTTFNGPFLRKIVYTVECETEVGETTGSSSLGPTRDGRFKPNIGAPGRFIVSCRTKTTNSYVSMSGTSMASPHVAGCISNLMTRSASPYKYNPAVTKAQVTAKANPYGDTLSWSSTSHSYYYRNGLGQIDGYKSIYQLNSAKGWTGGWATATLNSSNSGTSFDVAIPSDATRTMFVVNFDRRRRARARPGQRSPTSTSTWTSSRSRADSTPAISARLAPWTRPATSARRHPT